MALRTPPNLYTGGAVVLNADPYLRFEANLQARKQAKEDAFNQYMRGLNQSINPSGLRNVDREAFEQKKNAWIKHGIENKEAIRNSSMDGGKANMKFMSDYQDLLNLTAESKQEEEKKKPFVNIVTDPNKRSQLSDRIFPMIESHDQPLYIKDKSGSYVRNENRKSIDYNSSIFNPKDFDALKQNQFWSAVEQGLPKEKKSDYGNKILDKETGKMIVPFTEGYSEDNVKNIADRAGQLIEGSDEAYSHYEKLLDRPNSDLWKKTNDAYQSVYGKDKMVETPQQFVQGEAIIRARAGAKKGEDRLTDLETAFDIYSKKAKLQSSLIEGRSSGIGGAEEGNVFLQSAIDAIGQGDEAAVQEIMQTLKKGGKFDQVDAKIKDGELIIQYSTPRGSSQLGVPIGGDRYQRRIPIDKNLGNALKGVYQGLTGSDVKFEKSPTPKPTKSLIFNGTTYTRAQLKKMSKRYTDEEIDKLIKEGTLKEK